MIRSTTVLTAVLLFFSLRGFSQCIIPPPPDPCTGSETLLTDNEILPIGTTKWYYGPDVTMNQLTMRGGKLIVCGNLTVNKFYMDSGTIIIRPGARFTDGGGLGVSLVFNGNSSVINYGTFQVYRNLVLDMGYASAAKPNVIINATTSSVMNVSFTYFVINNPYSYFVNNGQADFGGIITDPGTGTGSICLGSGSQTLMNILINKKYNAYTATAGPACVRVNQFSQFYDSLTTSPNINACLSSSYYSDSSCKPFGCKPNAWGAANQFRNCGSCATISLLAIRMGDYTLSAQQGFNKLHWKVNTTSGNLLFKIERSADGKSFRVVDSFPGNDRSSFEWQDNNTSAGIGYYRIQCVNLQSGTVTTSPVLSGPAVNHQSAISIYPNPVRNELTAMAPAGKKIQRLQLFTISGRKIFEQPLTDINDRVVSVRLPATIQHGLYIVKLLTNDAVFTTRIIKE